MGYFRLLPSAPFLARIGAARVNKHHLDYVISPDLDWREIAGRLLKDLAPLDDRI